VGELVTMKAGVKKLCGAAPWLQIRWKPKTTWDT
jgi:hypothetical protein